MAQAGSQTMEESRPARLWDAGVFRFDVRTALGAAAWLVLLEFLVDLSASTVWLGPRRVSLGVDWLRVEMALIPAVVGLALGYLLGLAGLVYGFVAAVLYLGEQHRFEGLWVRAGTLWAAGYSYHDDALALFGATGGALLGAVLVSAVCRRRQVQPTCSRGLSRGAMLAGGLLCAAAGLWLTFQHLPEEFRNLYIASYYSQGPVLVAFGGLAGVAGLLPPNSAQASGGV